MTGKIKEIIKERAFSSPVLSAISASLFAVVIFSVPSLFVPIVSEGGLFALNIVCRTVAFLLALFLARACGFKLFNKPNAAASAILLFFLGLLVCVNNFPIIGFAAGDVWIVRDRGIARFIFYCVAIGVSEEFVFRGFVMPLIGHKLAGNPRAAFWTVALSAAIFSFCHLFNIFSAGVVPTLLQAGYTFLTGCLFGTIFLFTENIVFPILLHAVYDVGGLIFSEPFGIAVGDMWNVYTIIITAVLGVFAAAVFAVKLWKYKSDGRSETQK